MSLIWTCPDCDADLEDERFAFWCPKCQHPVPFDLMVTDPDDERDRMTDLREAAREF